MQLHVLCVKRYSTLSLTDPPKKRKTAVSWSRCLSLSLYLSVCISLSSPLSPILPSLSSLQETYLPGSPLTAMVVLFLNPAHAATPATTIDRLLL